MKLVEVSDNFVSLLGNSIDQSSLLSIFDNTAMIPTKYYFTNQNNIKEIISVANSVGFYMEFLQKWVVRKILMSANDSAEYSKSLLYNTFQLPDQPVNIKSLSGQGRKGWDRIHLVPDHYYFSHRGYENFLVLGDPAVIPWEYRSATVFWRGSTTGYIEGGAGYGRYIDSFDGLPRYRLCRIASSLEQVADVGIFSVAQAGADAQIAIEERLMSEGLMRPFLPMQQWAAYKFIIDIDGNVSAWNFVQRMRLGCCILKIDSPWTQWFSDRLCPWVHFVPVAADFSDLPAKIEWCLTHDKEAEQIAHQARAFALSMTFEEEMHEAAFRFVAASEPIDGPGQDFLNFQDIIHRIKLSGAPFKMESARERHFVTTCHNTILGRAADGGLIQLQRNGDLDRAVVYSSIAEQGEQVFPEYDVDTAINLLTLKKNCLYLRANDDKLSTSLVQERPSTNEIFELMLETDVLFDQHNFIVKHKNKIITTFHRTILGIDLNNSLIQVTSGEDFDKIIVVGENDRFHRIMNEYMFYLEDDDLYFKRGLFYACAESDLRSVICNRRTPSFWETFRLIPINAVRFSIESKI